MPSDATFATFENELNRWAGCHCPVGANQLLHKLYEATPEEIALVEEKEN